ncbi:MAG: 2-amino-4-hydroxy-6-hydroxymethyldihydropteridine diphosphokinase [Anaerolineales bacterium]|nr:2-amino-4-hydroxy-6-hydroxymethyldihydropteridine diphosphokinase [Anaerolineales bacterium]
MNETHRAYLNLGSNLEPEKHILQALKLLSKAGTIEAVSSVWETESVGYPGPNFLNLCILLVTPFNAAQIRHGVTRPIESALGRMRSKNKNAPRQMDIDIVLFDDVPHKIETWSQAFVGVPLAELLPDFETAEGEKLSDFAARIQSQAWMRKRDDLAISAAALRRD